MKNEGEFEEIRRDCEVLKRGRGRPKIGIGNDVRLDVRISKDEDDMLKHMLIESDKTKSELVRKAITMYYNAYYGRW